MESILTSIKKMVNVTESDHSFDADLIVYINAAFAILKRLGVGPAGGFAITNEYATWAEFLPSEPQYEIVKTFVYLKTKLLFDPPTNSAVIESINKQIAEIEWQLVNMV
jgi:hypothetical protein